MSQAETLTRIPEGTLEEPLIEESQWGAIRALRQRGRSKKAIARELGLDIKTVRKWLGQEWKAQQRPNRDRGLDGYREFLFARAPEVGFNAVVLSREVRAKGYGGSARSVRRYIQPWRRELALTTAVTARFETEPGEQAQVDWGSTRVWLADEPVRVHLFLMVLGFSRRLFGRAYLNERIDALLDGHEKALNHFGGRPKTILYDNPRTIVKDKDEERGLVTWNPAFKDRLDFYDIEPKLCRFYRAQTKGKVESAVKYVKRNALAGRRFRDLEDLNAWLMEWCVAVADQRIHGTTHERPGARFARAEAAALRPLGNRRPPARERQESRIVPRDGYVMVDTNRYPAPLSWVGRKTEVHILVEEIVLLLPGQEPVRHPRLDGKHQMARWHGPPRSVPKAVRAGSEPPRFDPAYEGGSGTVAVRSLESYEALCQEVSP